jgi:hypothetical protein
MAETKDITVIDTRLAEGFRGYGRPSISETIKVNQTTPLPDLMRKIKAAVDYPRIKIGMLIIGAHGYAEPGVDGALHDGFGMQLCQEDLTMQSVHFFRALEGQFENRDLGITLVGCGVARQERVKTASGTLMGFGEKLCVAIARATMTGVVASTETHKGYEGKIRRRVGGAVEDTPVFDPGSWEGAVYIFTPDGSKTKAPPGLLARLVKGAP